MVTEHGKWARLSLELPRRKTVRVAGAVGRRETNGQWRLHLHYNLLLCVVRTGKSDTLPRIRSTPYRSHCSHAYHTLLSHGNLFPEGLVLMASGMHNCNQTKALPSVHIVK